MARKRDHENEKEIRLRFDKALSKLLAETEWEKITIRSICEEAGVSVGLFYYYYETKQHLFSSKFSKVDDYFRDHVSLQCEQYALHEALEYYTQTYIKWIKRKGYQYMTQVMKFYLHNQPDLDWFSKRALYISLKEIIQRGFDDGEIVVDLTVDDIAMDLTLMVRGHSFQWCSSQENYPLNEAVSRNTEIYYNSISNHK